MLLSFPLMSWVVTATILYRMQWFYMSLTDLPQGEAT